MRNIGELKSELDPESKWPKNINMYLMKINLTHLEVIWSYMTIVVITFVHGNWKGILFAI